MLILYLYMEEGKEEARGSLELGVCGGEIHIQHTWEEKNEAEAEAEAEDENEDGGEDAHTNDQPANARAGNSGAK